MRRHEGKKLDQTLGTKIRAADGGFILGEKINSVRE
jgi:hypothetical protein